jgi:signal transduction histidine kinase
MLTGVRSRRAWIYILSVLALLVPAGGIAYLGAVSYRDERGALSAQHERQRQAALGVVHRIERAIEDALDTVERATQGAGDGRSLGGLARHWYWIDADGRMRVPRAIPDAAVDSAGALDRGAPCTSAARLEDCVRELSTRQSRVARLHAAQRAEACTGASCTASLADARRAYLQLAAFDDTGPDALLGLARVLHRSGDDRGADRALDDIDRRFPDGAFDHVPARIVTSVMRAERVGPAALLDVAEAIVAGRYAVDPVVGLGVVTRLRARLAGELPAALTARLAALDESVADLRIQARAAQGLADDKDEILRSAGAKWRGRQATHQPGRTLIYRRRADGGVIGIAVDAGMLEEAAGHDSADDVARNVRPIVLQSGAKPPADVRALEQLQFGEELPHLALVLANPISDPDPNDEIVRQRSKRHVALTSVLALALGLGLLATIRGAARARELAQLKSDFVSTVSHELKTPLTSIRMFAEMLEQGVAQGDPAKMARYHHVIVQESQRLGLLIANLLDYAQIERGTRRYTPAAQPIGELASHAVSTFETLRDADRGGRNPIEVRVSPKAMAASVQVDRDVVVQALLNLLANAAKYGGADKPIEVAVDADDVLASISVRDHGPGIPPAEQARIFREFYRAPEAYRSGVEGTGLGLALVKRHIEALGGTVEVASEVGEGATFTIRFPRSAHAAAAAEGGVA